MGTQHASSSSSARLSEVDATVQAWIDRFARWLPEQRPLSIFVHNNPLEPLEHMHFHAVCEAATRIRGARTTLAYERYRQMLADHQLRGEDVAAAMTHIEKLSLDRVDDLPVPRSGTLLLSLVRPEMEIEIGEMVDGFLMRILPAFLDLGSALWPMPNRERGLLETMRWLARTPLGVPEAWLGGLAERLGHSGPRELIVECLEKRGDPETGWPNILHEALFALPGYAGMIHRLEHVENERPKGVEVSLLDYVAVRLVVEELALTDVARRLFGRRATLGTLAQSLGSLESASDPMWSIELGAFQDAYEEEYVRSFMGSIVMAADLDRGDPVAPDVQFICCIDDRLESIRRHVEECIPNTETFGSAGFFGVAIKHRAPLDMDEAFSCPAPVTPTKRVTEQLDHAGDVGLLRGRRRRRLIEATIGDDASRSPMRGLLSSFVAFARAPQMLMQMLFPAPFVHPAHEFEGTKLLYDKELEPEGFTLDEQIALVEANLRNIGMISRFARWVLIIGHGSMAVNNQFMSGYQCGACGGKRGGINARVHCAFANNPLVRDGLAKRGIEIPAATIFMPGEHDTALDIIRWFDVDKLDSDRRAELEELRRGLAVALERNAKERSRRFDDIPLGEPLAETVARVRTRCVDYAETRPEYNHATNASCVIGRRSLTRALFLDRRAFLVSYDPTTDDPELRTLEKLMAAPLPVCAGISHEYFFSTMDPLRFGCGTKLPHNVVGLLGVCTGADGDLRPGLWRQTTEIHDPIRLVTLIEAEPEAIAEVLERLPAVKNKVVNAWIHMFASSPSGRGFFRWVEQGFVPYAPPRRMLYEVGSSLEACEHTRGNVEPCLISNKPNSSRMKVAS